MNEQANSDNVRCLCGTTGVVVETVGDPHVCFDLAVHNWRTCPQLKYFNLSDSQDESDMKSASYDLLHIPCWHYQRDRIQTFTNCDAATHDMERSSM